MEETKKPWTSVTMWAGVIGLIALNAKTFGLVDITPEDQKTITDLIVNLIEQGAVIVAMWGRYRAKKEIVL